MWGRVMSLGAVGWCDSVHLYLCAQNGAAALEVLTQGLTLEAANPLVSFSDPGEYIAYVVS